MSLKGQMKGKPLDLNTICDVCHRGRGHGSHAKCSEVRKQRYKHLHGDA